MTEEEMKRYHKAEKLSAEIRKYYKQLESIQKCDKVTVFGYEEGKKIVYDITPGNGFYPVVKDFLMELRHQMLNLIRQKEKEYDEL